MITFIMDLENQEWICSGEPTSSDSLEAYFYLDMIPGKTPFKNFDFDFMLKGKNDFDVVVTTETEEEIMLRSKNQETETEFPYLCNVHYFSNLLGGEKYVLELSFINRRKPVTASFSFTMPKPEKPYDNWVWDEESCKWQPPLPMPEPSWDQESQKWIIP